MKFSAIPAITLAGLVPSALAILAPAVPSMNIVWQESFDGCAGCQPNTNDWRVELDIHNNNEVQTYTNAATNLQLSGGSSLQVVPWKDAATGGWTSSRIESIPSWTPQPRKKLQVQAMLRMGDNLQKQGMWPAFWMLGDAMRHGTPWPLCGELDIMEQVNGQMTGYGTVHCGAENGGPCNEPMGKGKSTPIPDNDFHTWSIVIDRSSGNWQTETIQWFVDGVSYHTVSGSEMGDEGTWGTLAHSPYYVLLNVAVGGNWPVSSDSLPSNSPFKSWLNLNN